MEGELLEEEIDSSLGFLRYDYPDTVYSELRKLFRDALHQHQDLNAIAQQLSANLDDERKILLGVQLYDLISKAGLKQEQVIAYYSFMSQLGMAAQAIDIVYQLNANDQNDVGIYHQGTSPLEVVSFGPPEHCDVLLPGLHEARAYFGLSLQGSGDPQEPYGPKPDRAGQGVEEWRLVPDLRRPADPDRRPGAHAPGPRLLFQRQKECLASPDLRHRQ